MDLKTTVIVVLVCAAILAYKMLRIGILGRGELNRVVIFYGSVLSAVIIYGLASIFTITNTTPGYYDDSIVVLLVALFVLFSGASVVFFWAPIFWVYGYIIDNHKNKEEVT